MKRQKSSSKSSSSLDSDRTADHLSDSSNDDNSSHNVKLPKRYKQLLNPYCQPHNVSDLTRRRWQQSGINIMPSTSRSNDNNSSDNESIASALSIANEVLENFDNNIVPDASNEFNLNNSNHSIEDEYATYDSNNDHAHENEQNVVDNEHDRLQDDEIYPSDIESESTYESESSEDEEDEQQNRGNEYFDRVMFPQSGLKVRDVMVLISAVSLKLGIHDEGKIVLGDMVKTLAGPESRDVSFSKYMMSKCISSEENKITSHYYCDCCCKTVLLSKNVTDRFRKKQVYCLKCEKNKELASSSSSNFLSIDLKHEIEILLSNSNLKNDILTNLLEHKNNASNEEKFITDIHDGSIYKNLVRNLKLEPNEYLATVNVGTDGAPLTKSGKKGFWPVQVMLNDFSPKIRFKNILLCGLMLTEKEPDSELLNLYVSTVFVDQMKNLSTDGIDLLTDTGEEVKIRFYTHACIVDAIGRRILQHRIQFNGFYGCSWCYQYGKYIFQVRGVRYVVNQPSNLRTHESHTRDLETREELNVQTFNGVNGECCLAELPFFDMVWSFPFEYLHGLLLGDTLTIWNEWKNGSSEYKIRPAEVDFIEKRFLKITPTREIHRLPRSGIIKGTAKPKGSELKSWLLYYSVPSMSGVLNDEPLEHYSLLVNIAYKVLSSKIARASLAQAELDLLEFVIIFELLYTETKMTFNIHSIRHIIESIRRTGPLIFNSAFPFESHIYHLKKMATGPKGMDKQIARKFLQKLVFTSGNINALSSNEDVKQFCMNLFLPIRLTKIFKNGEDAVFCGKGRLENILELGLRLVYKKCIYNGAVYTSIQYTQAKKTDDSIIKLKTGEFCKIIKIIEDDTNCYLQVRMFELFPDLPFSLITHLRKIQSENIDNERIISVNDIEDKALMINVRNARYLCTLVNNIEIQ